MSPERSRPLNDPVDRRLDALEAKTGGHVEALTKRILYLEKEQARLAVLLDALRARPPAASG